MKLFIYGTLEQQYIQQSLYGRLLEMQPAKLPNYAISYALNSSGTVLPYKTIIKSDLDIACASGHIVDLTDEEMRITDSYEGCPDLYQRITVEVVDENNNKIPCTTYINGYLTDMVNQMYNLTMPEILNQVISENNFTKAYFYNGVQIFISKAFDEDSDKHFLVHSIPLIPELNVHHLQFPIEFESEAQRDEQFDSLDLEIAGEAIEMFKEYIQLNSEKLKSEGNGN